MTATHTTIPLLKADDVVARLKDLRSRQPVKFDAFYSSQLGGIVTDPAAMVIPFDDHMVHRGHGIFDTAGLINGKIYDLDAHLDRFLLSAERSKLRILPSREEMRDIIIKTTAAERAARRIDPVLVVIGTWQPRAHSGGWLRAGVLRDGVRRPRLPGSLADSRAHA